MTDEVVEEKKKSPIDYEGKLWPWTRNRVADALVDLMPDTNWEDPEMQKTPERWAKMMIELTDRTPHDFEFTMFDSFMDEMIVVEDIPVVTLCSHHLIPFIGKCQIGYVPQGRVAGLSKFPRLVNQICKGTWKQEDLTEEIAEVLEARLRPLGVAVVIRAEHLCMTIRGVQAPGTRTTTSKMTGCFADHSRTARAEFLSLIRNP